MAKFNNRAKVQPANITVNLAGGPAYTMGAYQALYEQVATSLWNGDGYYEKSAEHQLRFQQNVEAVANLDLKFAYKLAAYARDKQGLKLRTSPVALFSELGLQKLGGQDRLLQLRGELSRKYAPLVISRADEPGEALAYVLNRLAMTNGNPKTWPHGLVKAIDVALREFNEYQLAKYDNSRASIKLRDVFRIIRPKPANDEQAALWGRAVRGELVMPDTWETAISAAGKDKDKKRDEWNRLIRDGKLGVFALLRNLRNIQESGADIEAALGQFTEDGVRNSGILPFQWYKAILNTDIKCQPTLAKCLEWSLAGLEFEGSTLVVCDNSGSMSSDAATRGMTMKQIGNLMGAMAVALNPKSKTIVFGTSAAWSDTNEHMSIMWNMEENARSGSHVGNSTNAYTIFPLIDNREFDRIILFSDMQCYDDSGYWNSGHPALSSHWKVYKRQHPNCKLYSVNLANQDNTSQFDLKDRSVMRLAGFSESIFQFISAMEKDTNIVNYINETY